MSAFRLPDTTVIAGHIRREAPHRLGLAVYADGQTWAVALVRASTGDVLAWDGWYSEPLTEQQRTPLLSLEWDEWDDMRSKLLLRGNEPWLGGPLGYHLMPSYSIARWAARILSLHAADNDHPADNRRGFGRGALVAYLPVVEEDVLLGVLAEDVRDAKERAKTSSSATVDHDVAIYELAREALGGDAEV